MTLSDHIHVSPLNRARVVLNGVVEHEYRGELTIYVDIFSDNYHLASSWIDKKMRAKLIEILGRGE